MRTCRFSSAIQYETNIILTKFIINAHKKEKLFKNKALSGISCPLEVSYLLEKKKKKCYV